MTRPWLGLVAAFVALNFLKGYIKKIMSDDRSLDSSSSSEITNFTNEAAHQVSASVMDEASCSGSSLIKTPSNFTGEVRKVNESVFELHKPYEPPKLQIVFFHGFQLGGYEDAHLSTWTSRDGSCVWPRTWLVEEFPHAHVFSVAYNARLTKSKEFGSMDLYNIGENIVSDLFGANIGQNPRCPLIVVGHSFGGIVIKQLCLHARNKGLLQHNNFLQNLKGVFFYSTPHHGAEFEKFAPRVIQQSPLLDNVKILSTSAARLHHDFENLRKVHYEHWQIEAVGESKPTKWGFGPIHELMRLPDHPSGLDQRVTKARRILDNTSVLCIVGMGGIGKTSIARELFNDVTIQFEYTCFVENAKGTSSIQMLKETVLNGFYQHGTKVQPGKMEWNFLMEKKTLIVMDDVDDDEQLKMLPKLKELGNGSRLVFTSRKHAVFSKYGKDAKLYDVEFLEDEEARKLLFQHVFDADRIPNNLEHLLEEHINGVVSKCQGLPLTIEVIGCYLRTNCHKVGFWKETIRKLGEAQSISGDKNDKVWASLMLSYSSLAQEEEEIFIDAATYFFEEPVEVALAAWSTPNGGVDTSWKNLIDRSLVKVDSEMRVWVHEQLRDLAKKVSRRQYCQCDLAEIKTSIVGELISVKLVENEPLQFWQTMTEGSEADNEEDGKVLPVCQLLLAEAARKLKYLRLDPSRDLIEGLSQTFPKDLSLLELMALDQMYPEFPDISWKGMNKLGVLRLRGFAVGTTFCDTLGKLVNLRILSLTDILGFDEFVAKDFGNLSSLKSLELHELNVSELSDWFGDLQALEYLSLSYLSMSELPESFGQLKALKILTIRQEEYLMALPESFGLLCCLEELTLEGCDALQRLPNNFGQLVGLKKLTINRAQQLQELCEKFESLSAMTQLELRECPKLENLPLNFGLLCGLEKLQLISCSHLQRLPDTFGQLTTLKKLTVKDADHLQDLCGNFGLLSGLEELELIRCSHLQRLPDTFGQLTALKKLTIEDADHLQDLCGNFGLLSGLEELELLKKLTIEDADHLQDLCGNFGLLSGLEELELTRCNHLVRLPDTFGQLTALKQLTIEEADHLEELCDNFGLLSSLEHLKLFGCSHLQRLPDTFGQLTALKELTILNGDHLQDLCDNFGLLRGLENLTLFRLRHLQRLPNTFGQLTTLKKLTIRYTDRLQDLCGNFGLLSGLEEVELDAGPDSYGPIQTLVNNLEKLTLLKKLKLTIRKTEHLVDLCDNAAGHFSAIGTLELDLYHMKVKRLPDNIGRLKALTKLSIAQPDWLEELPDSIGQIPSLREIQLYECDGLWSLPDSLGKTLSPQLALPQGDEASPSRTKAETSDAAVKAVWHKVTCQGCKMKPIEGDRFISTRKPAYDLCSDCFETNVNPDPELRDFVRSCQPPEANSMELDVTFCKYLTHEVLTKLGWVQSTKTSVSQCYQRILLH